MMRWICLLLVLLLAACGDDQGGGNGLVSAGKTGGETRQPARTADGPTLSAEGLVVYLEGEALVALVDGEPVLLADDVTEETLWPAPSQTRLLFGTAQLPETHLIHRIDVESASAEVVHQLTGHIFWFSTWSPDDEWLLVDYVSARPVFVRHDGEAVVPLFDLTSERFTINYRQWLADGTLLIADGGEDLQTGRMEFERIAHVEPDVPQATMIAPTQDYESLAAVAAALGRQVATPSYHVQGGYVSGGVMAAPSLGACDPWRILHQGQTIYEAQDVYSLSGITAVANSIYFVQWVYPDCRLSVTEPPQASLMQLGADGEAVAVVESGLSSAFAASREVSALPRYALSPGGDQVVWIGGSLEGGITTVNVLDLETGVSRQLVDSTVNIATGAGVIRGIFWLRTTS